MRPLVWLCATVVALAGRAPATLDGRAPAPPPPPTLQAAFRARCARYLNITAHSYDNLVGDATRAALHLTPPGKPMIRGDYNGTIQNMRDRKDCSDFNAPMLMRVLYTAGANLPPAKRAQLKAAFQNWQFWVDEVQGGFEGGMEVWTENHQMDFHVSEYLAGMLWPTELFPGTNMTGKQHADRGREFVVRWLERRYRWGFSEWRSDTYNQFDFHRCCSCCSYSSYCSTARAAAANRVVADRHSVSALAALATEPRVAARAAVVLELMLIDVAMHSFHGQRVSSMGRSYGNSKWSWASSGTHDLSCLLSGVGLCSSCGAGSYCAGGTAEVGVCLAALGHSSNTQAGYSVSDVTLGIAADVNTRTFVAKVHIA